IPFRIIGIRPGEKLHEVMCPADDSHLTLEFENHYVIQPSLVYISNMDYSVDGEGVSGCPVPMGFEYNSGTNPNFLSIEQIRAICEP
ncbi:MAG: polysaccharide biosynthesis protein, partial [Synergistaceae bacterium]|nr:polysaccharide biosynthesis protein [Synergistaceae bacterium]